MTFLKIIIFVMVIHFVSLSQGAIRLKRDTIQDIWGDPYQDNDGITTITSVLQDDASPSDSCECVPYYLCQNGTVNKNGEGIFDIRISECQSYLERCCKTDNILSNPLIAPSPQKKCGIRNTNGIGFKIKDPSNNEAEFGEFPWMVAVFIRLQEKSKNIPVYQCGGALIHPEVILTAAHCVKDKQNLKVRAGEWDTQTTKEQYPFQDRDVISLITHPEYIPGPLFNDIALLFVEVPFEMAPHINVVCLPPPQAVINRKDCFSSGWGKNNFGNEDQYQVILKKVNLPMVEKRKCQENLRQTRLGKHFQLHESFVCAGGEAGKDVCTGDGGSPLVCPIDGQEGRYYHVGIVAWGIGCGEFMVPGVYVNVALFRTWIDEQLEKRQLDISVYRFES